MAPTLAPLCLHTLILLQNHGKRTALATVVGAGRVRRHTLARDRITVNRRVRLCEPREIIEKEGIIQTTWRALMEPR